MIVVKTKATLRITENGKKRLISKGARFQERTIEDLPQWLQDHIAYFRKTPTCTTLIINETPEIAQPIAPKGVEKVKRVVREVKKVEEVKIPEEKIDLPPAEEGLGLPDPKIVIPAEPKKEVEEPVKEEPKKVTKPKVKATPKKEIAKTPKLRKRTPKK
jgi:NifB/MoaA-like Fe-S oxidoreductase